MAQIRTLQRFNGTFRPGVTHTSLTEMIMAVAGEDQPVTLRQVVHRGFYNIDAVTAALRERTRSGTIATFKIGPLYYYASPQNALTAKGPTFIGFAMELINSTLWEGKRRIYSIVEKVCDFTGWW